MIVFFLALVVEAVVFGVIVAAALRERATIETLVFSAEDVEQDDDALAQLELPAMPDAFDPAATELAIGLRNPTKLDEALSHALLEIAVAPLRPRLLAGIGADIGLLVVALSPALLALLTGASDLGEIWVAGGAATGPHQYATALRAVPEAFSSIRPAFAATAILLVGLAALWAGRWWLWRPEVREARMLDACLQTTAAARPGASVIVSSKLGNLLAPSREIGPPARAWLAGIAMVAAAWLLVTLTADFRRANSAPASFDAWPGTAAAAPDETATSVPAYPAGGPFDHRATPRLEISYRAATLAARPLLRFESGRITDRDWARKGKTALEALDNSRRPGHPLEVAVHAHPLVPMATVTKLLSTLGEKHGVGTFLLVLERHFATNGTRPWAALRAVVAADKRPSAIPVHLAVGARSVRVDPGLDSTIELTFEETDWERRLHAAVRERTGVGVVGRRADPRVSVKADDDARYDAFARVLAAADSVCQGNGDCGLPGLGLTFIVGR